SSNNDQVIVTQAPVESTSNNFRAPEKRRRGRPKKNKENDANLITENQTNDENSNQSARLSKRRKPVFKIRFETKLQYFNLLNEFFKVNFKNA
ncbi:hypothetical protein BpHYR1_003650, partial [Brachionus plicatilis]